MGPRVSRLAWAFIYLLHEVAKTAAAFQFKCQQLYMEKQTDIYYMRKPLLLRALHTLASATLLVILLVVGTTAAPVRVLSHAGKIGLAHQHLFGVCARCDGGASRQSLSKHKIQNDVRTPRPLLAKKYRPTRAGHTCEWVRHQPKSKKRTIDLERTPSRARAQICCSNKT